MGLSFDLAFDAKLQAFDGVFVKHAATTTTFPMIEILITTIDTITVPNLGVGLDINTAGQPTVPALSQRGDKAFFITVDRATNPNTQVFLTKGPLNNDPLVVVCYEGMQVPNMPSIAILKAAAPFGIAASGATANLDIGFRASTSTMTNGSAGIFRWDAQTASIQLVAHTDQVAEDTGGDTFDLIAGPSNNQYVAEFGSSVHGAFRATTIGTTDVGIWVDDPASGVPLVVMKGADAPGTTGPVPFLDFLAPAVNSLAQVAFRGCLTGGCVMDGIWTDSSGTLSLVALDGGNAPDSSGTGISGQFISFSDPVLNDAGAIAFRATSTTGPEGIWRRGSAPGAQLRRVVKSQDSLPGSGVQFVSFGPDIAISETGELAFTAAMSDGKQGLFTTFLLGSTTRIVKIVKEGDAFRWDSATTKTIDDIFFYPGAYSMGTAGFIHMDAGPLEPQAVGFSLKFSDQTRAMVLSTVER